MATVNILSNGSHPGGGGLQATLDYCMQDEKTMYEGQKLVYGMNCSEQDPYLDMMTTKKLYGKTGGRMYYHLDQSFSPEEKITPEQAHKIAIEFAESQFKGYEVLIATHVDAQHIHSHFVVNSVSFEGGRKYHSGKDNIKKLRDASDEICRKYGLSVVEPKKAVEKRMGTREYRSALKGNSWKINLVVVIEEAMKRAKTKDEYKRFMENHGYKVTWTDSRKYITYTTPEGNRVRDNRLHEKKFTKEMMEYEFRIREELVYGKADCDTETDRCREADTMLFDHTGELENSYPGAENAASDYGKDGHERADGELLQPIGRDISERNGLAGKEGTGSERGDGLAEDSLGEGNGETGWETERAICFGFGENQNGIAEADAGEYGETVSPDSDPMSAYDILSGGAYLAANLVSAIDSRPRESNEEFRHKPKKERKNYQKNDREGPTMSM